MKTNEISQDTLGNALVMALGVAGGVALSGSLNNLAKAYLPTSAGDEIGQAGVAGLGLLGGAYIKPSNKNDKLGQALQMLSIGVAAKSGYDLAVKAVKPAIDVKPVEERNAIDHVLYGAVGLGCACNGNAYSGMNAALPTPPVIEFEPIEEEANGVASLMGDVQEVEVASLI